MIENTRTTAANEALARLAAEFKRSTEKMKYAEIQHRISSALLNLVLGSTPIWVPSYLVNYSKISTLVDLNVYHLDAITIVLAGIQIAFVAAYRGSPGYALVGLYVQSSSGKRVSGRVFLYRSIPYIIAVFSVIFIRHSGGYPWLEMIAGILYILCGLFLLISAVVLLADGKLSLIDRLTGTVVCKYSK